MESDGVERTDIGVHVVPMETSVETTNKHTEDSNEDDIKDIPLDKSLLTEGILDSFAIIELVEFIEVNWSIKIEDDDFTSEKMGSINKMVKLISEKINT